MEIARTPTQAPVEAATILVVDDDPRSREIVATHLRRSYQVTEATGGASALELQAERPFDLVVLDVMMPGMSGYEVCRRLKDRAPDDYLPVLLLTALGDQKDRNAGLQAGADDFLTKPVDPRELQLRVKAFIQIRLQERIIRRQLADLERLQALKDELCALIAHDVRNPLSAIAIDLQLLEVLARKQDAPQLAEPIRRLLSSTRRLDDLVGDFLAVRLLEEAEMVARREEVDIGALVSDALAVLEPGARGLGIRLAATVDPGLTASIDRKLVRRSIENVVGNALKYSPEGTVVEISACAAPRGIEIEIADRGPGIPDEMKHKIFEKYGSVEARQTGGRRGFGLGLYFVHMATAAHGGTVDVRDREGGGAIFRLHLPEGG